MEGLECKLLSAWPFDPLSPTELLLLPHARVKAIDPSSSNDLSYSSPTTNTTTTTTKLLAFQTLNLNTGSLSPFDVNLHLSNDGVIEDVNNNANNNGHGNVINGSPLVGVSFLTLDPLVAEEVAPSLSPMSTPPPSITNTTLSVPSPSDNGSGLEDGLGKIHHILTSCFSPTTTTMTTAPTITILHHNGESHHQHVEDDKILPKFSEIQFSRSNNKEDNCISIISTLPPPSASLHIPITDDRSDLDVDDVEGIYFGIQDLDQYDRDVKGYLIEDLMGDCSPPTTTTFSHSTIHSLDVGLDIDDDLEDAARTSRSNSNSFDLDMDFEEKASTYADDDDEIKGSFDGDDERGSTISLEEGEKQELKCKFCGFVCCSKSSLGIHERRHTGERPYSCKYCGRPFNSAQCCKHHERLHTGDKPFECQYCGKKYAVSTRLKRHERVHTREEPYKCGEPGCGKTFRWFDAFRDHRNTHNGVPLYLCSVCGKSFTSYLKFYYHERGHFLKRERDRDRQRKAQQQAQLNGGSEQIIPQTKGRQRASAKANNKAKVVAAMTPPN